MDEVRQAVQICPQRIAQAIMRQPHSQLEEVRMRLGRPPTYLQNGQERQLVPQEVCTSDLQEVLDRASASSAYAAQQMLKNGFLTIPGGHRLGLCGRGVYKNGEFYTLTELSSVSLRIARSIFGVADSIRSYLWTHPQSTLIIAPPGRGKTTLLRDLIRQLSDRFSWRIGLVDERSEVAACLDGKAQLDVGKSTDILTAICKAEGIEMLLRTMNPQWIAVDEITAEADVEAICRASYCGVRFLATAHAATVKELSERPIYRGLMQSRIFGNVVRIDAQRNLHMEVAND
ncbi:MAG: stage III sporulation protein AB [Ruminococcaceae bacterium]|nr:stage III sporulation protein AB [Oscillospiraceae bacterium]